MRRYNDYVYNTLNEKIYYPEDIAALKRAIPELERLHATLIQRMYSDYSDSFSASWLTCDEYNIAAFRNWLEL